MANNLDQAIKNRTDIAEIQRKYKTGEITRDRAKELARPVIDRINQQTIAKTKELNKKYGMSRKPALLDFINAMRNTY